MNRRELWYAACPVSGATITGMELHRYGWMVSPPVSAHASVTTSNAGRASPPPSLWPSSSFSDSDLDQT
jgi:hypothetical protein